MAIEKVIEIVADTKQAADEIKSLFDTMVKQEKEAQKQTEKLVDEVQDIGKTSKNAEKGIKNIGKAFKGVGLAIKALGIGLLLEAFSILKDLFSQNQKVADFFATTMEALSIVFNDFFEFIFNNAGTVVDFFKDIFENPVENIKALGDAIVNNIIERFNSLIETTGLLGLALKKLFEGDFKGALDTAKAAGKEAVDIFTGVDGTVDKVTEGITKLVEKSAEYLSNTVKQAKANVELRNTAELAAASQSRLVEQYDRLAEKQRQLRDDESKSISERVAANEKLAEVLEQQEKAMLRLADLQIAAAQANVNTNDTIENQVALTEALANKEAVLAQIEGFRSEQLVNRIALQKEQLELDNTIADGEKERRLAQLEFEESQNQNEAEKLELQRLRLEEENQIILDDIERKRELYALGTQARVDAEQEYLTRKQEIDNEITATERQQNELRRKSAEALEDAKINLAQAGLSILGSLSKEGSALAKGVAVSQAVISTYQGVNKALAETTDFTPTQTLRFANAAAVGIAGALNVAKILSTNESGQTNVSAPSSGGGTSAPSFNLVQGTGTNQIAESLQNQGEPLRAFVVSQEVTSSQELDRNIKDNASI